MKPSVFEKDKGFFDEWAIWLLPKQMIICDLQSVKVFIIEGSDKEGLKKELSTEELEKWGVINLDFWNFVLKIGPVRGPSGYVCS